MLNLIFVRHARGWHQEDEQRVQACPGYPHRRSYMESAPIPLCPEGEQEAAALANVFPNLMLEYGYTNLDIALSHYIRAQDTAIPLIEALNSHPSGAFNLTTFSDRRLGERDSGLTEQQLQGHLKRWRDARQLALMNATNPNRTTREPETNLATSKRVMSFHADLLQRHATHAKILVFHGISGTIYLETLHNPTRAEFLQRPNFLNNAPYLIQIHENGTIDEIGYMLPQHRQLAAAHQGLKTMEPQGSIFDLAGNR